MEEDVDGSMSDLSSLNYDDLDSISKIQKTQYYNDIMQVSDLTLRTTFVKCNKTAKIFFSDSFLVNRMTIPVYDGRHPGS